MKKKPQNLDFKALMYPGRNRNQLVPIIQIHSN